jgi:predicted permease
MLRELLSRISGTFRRNRLEEEFDEEVRDHLSMLTERFIRQGMDPVVASYAALRQFGGVTQMKQDLRERRALPPLDVLAQDVQHAFRQLRRAKWFTASAALTLALGIGASTAVFAVLDTVVLRPLPFAEPDRLISFRSLDRRGPRPTTLSYPNFFDFRTQNRVFEHLASYRDDLFTLSDSLPTIEVPGEIVAADLFTLLGVQPALGRGFLPDEEKPGTHIVILSDALWKSRFAGDPGILKRHIRINDKSFTVAGVAPAGFQFPLDNPAVQLWTTLSEDTTVSEFTPLSEQRGARTLDVLGRLKRGVTADEARAQMDVIAGGLARAYPDDNKNLAATVLMPEQERLTGTSRQPLWILLGAVGLVLLIACANVANLLLARSTERAREFTLRAAIGASRPALVRQLLIESLALGLVGASGGLFLAWGMLKAIVPLAGDSIPRLSQTGLDARVMVFSALVAVMTSVLFSVAPATQVIHADLAGALKQGAPNIARGHHRFRNVLVVCQITLGLALVVGAELLMTSFVQLMQRDPGFRSDHLLTFCIGMPETAQSVSAQIALNDQLMERFRAVPGVRAASTGMPLPLQGHEISVSFDIEERPTAPSERPHSDMAIVTPGYFGTMGIPFRKGRDFSERDDAKAARVVVVNEAFAHKYFPGEDVIGKRIKPGATNGKEGVQSREIVGVVENAKQAPLTADPDPIYYFPYKQLSWGIGTFVLKTAVPPLELESAVRTAIENVDRQIPMYKVRSGESLSTTAIAQPRFLMVLMGCFAAIALVLTAIGLYGVLSYAVARRRREIGVRIALGAGRRDVLGMVLRDAMQLVAAGLLLGLAGAIVVSRLLAGVVYGVRPGDPMILASACCLMVITGLAAAYVPAARAASVDPMKSLRSE